MTDIVEQIRSTWITDRVGTHYRDCYLRHPECAIWLLLEEINYLKENHSHVRWETVKEFSTLADALKEIERLREELKIATVVRSFDERISKKQDK